MADLGISPPGQIGSGFPTRFGMGKAIGEFKEVGFGIQLWPRTPTPTLIMTARRQLEEMRLLFTKQVASRFQSIGADDRTRSQAPVILAIVMPALDYGNSGSTLELPTVLTTERHPFFPRKYVSCGGSNWFTQPAGDWVLGKGASGVGLPPTSPTIPSSPASKPRHAPVRCAGGQGQLEAAQHAQLVSTLLGTLTASTTPEELAAMTGSAVAQHFDLPAPDRPKPSTPWSKPCCNWPCAACSCPRPTDRPASALLQKSAPKRPPHRTSQIKRVANPAAHHRRGKAV